jgi:hypothetical protein
MDGLVPKMFVSDFQHLHFGLKHLDCSLKKVKGIFPNLGKFGVGDLCGKFCLFWCKIRNK